MSNSDGDKVVHPPESGSFLHPLNLISLVEGRANGIKHFRHNHVLTFKEDVRNGVKGTDLCCKLCGIETGSRGFSCDMENCKFLLHEFCAFLPKEMKDHPKHPEHPLILLDYNYYHCHVCDNRNRHTRKQFYYKCIKDCGFSVDLGCASMSILVYNNDIHNHELTPQLYPSSFMCQCCGEKHTELGTSYQCRTCSFRLHEECSSLSPKIKHDSHVCQLRLSYFNRIQWENDAFHISISGNKCGVCDKNMEIKSCFYGCDRCKYLIHIKCSIEKWNPEIEDVDPDQIKDRFPLSSAELVQKRLAQFIQNKCEWKDAEDKNGDILNHPAHHHPLTLEFGSSKFIRSIDSEDIAKRGKYHVCNACILPLLDAPLYSCTQSCKFVLHKWCARLPHELKHPAHTGHTLILHKKLDKFFGFFKCKGCNKIGNGFAYKCNECEEYCLDLRCATLPSSIYYGTHDRPLCLKHRNISGGCISCGMSNFHECKGRLRCNYNLHRTDESPCSPPFLFGRDDCHYNICINCVTLPEEVLHWYDPHGFKLTHLADVPPHNNNDIFKWIQLANVPTHDDNTNLRYHCEFCEDELNTNQWIYHCAECDQSVHARCVRHAFCLLPRPIKFGESYDSPYHKELGHKLICFEITKELQKFSECKRCKVYNWFTIAFKCKKCEIVLCLNCASSDVNV